MLVVVFLACSAQIAQNLENPAFRYASNASNRIDAVAFDKRFCITREYALALTVVNGIALPTSERADQDQHSRPR
jgi:hypothetical protein